MLILLNLILWGETVDREKILDVVIKGNTILSSVRKISKAVNIFRVFSYVSLTLIVVMNVFGVLSALKQ